MLIQLAVQAALPFVEIPPVDYNTIVPIVALGLICTGITAGCYLYIRDKWRARREKIDMITKDRNDREHALLLEILTDGILDRQVAGEISGQVARRMLFECGRKLELLDLLPKSKIAELVKVSLKGDKYRREFQRKLGLYKERPLEELAKIDPPVVKVKVTTMGKAAAKLFARNA